MPNLNNLTTQDLQWGTANWSGQGYIDGLQMQWVSGTAVTVTSGAAFIPLLNKCLPVPNAIALTGLVLTSSTFYHLYLYDNAGTPAVECVTTAPDAPYSGTARAKTGDASRRYVGSVLTDGSNNILNFTHTGSAVQYKANINAAPLVALTAGTATTPTGVSLASAIPLSAKLALLSTTNSDSSVAAVFGTSDQGYTLSVSAWSSLLNPVSAVVGPYVINSSLVIQYMYRATPTGNVYIRVVGYQFER